MEQKPSDHLGRFSMRILHADRCTEERKRTLSKGHRNSMKGNRRRRYKRRKIKWRHARATLLAGRPKRHTSAQSRQFPNMLWPSPKNSFWWTETFFAIFQSFMSNSFRLYLNSEKIYPEHIPNIPKICICHYKPLFGNHGSMHFNEHPSWQHL